MQLIRLFCLIVCLLGNISFSQEKSDFPILKGSYFDQEIPGKIEPEVFISINPVVSLHYYVRSILESEEKAKEPYKSVVDLAHDFRRTVNTPLRWGFIEPFLTKCQTVDDLYTWVGKIPERFRFRSGKIVKPREMLIPYIKELAVVESDFMKNIWPLYNEDLSKAKEELDGILSEYGPELLCYITDKLNMEKNQRPVRIYLINDAPPPSGSTCSARGVGVVSFVNITNLSNSTLIEVVLHELIHALDLNTRGEPTVLNLIREKLGEVGIQPDNPLFRDLPHAVIFEQAAETVQRFLDYPHNEYRHNTDFYKQASDIVKQVPSKWKTYLEGSMSIEEIVNALVAVEQN